jgi:hypothetical protein
MRSTGLWKFFSPPKNRNKILMLELVVNELSFRQLNSAGSAAPDIYTARVWMSQFTGTIRAARQMGFGTVRTEKGFAVLELSPGYSMPQWRNDPDVNRDEKVFLSSMTAKSPYLDGVLDEIAEAAERMEVCVDGSPSSGLLAALLLDAIAVSWPSHNIWASHLLVAEFRQLSLEGELLQREVELRHASVSHHWETHRAWIEQKRRASLTNGQELWAKAQEFFPYLEFCGNAEVQICALTGNEKYFDWVVRCFTLANLQCSQWTTGLFPHSLLPGPATGESLSVHDDPKLRAMRVFRMVSGKMAMFEHHMKNNAENKRIHYFADNVRRKVCIAYLGDHLPTARY